MQTILEFERGSCCRKIQIVSLLGLWMLIACVDQPETSTNRDEVYFADLPRTLLLVEDSVPHDTANFTQGLLFDDSVLMESTGLYGRSAIFRTQMSTRRGSLAATLPPDVFGEGITIAGGYVLQATWRNGFFLKYERRTLAPVGVAHFPGEMWGLATDADGYIVLSDGTDELKILDPQTLRIMRRLNVQFRGVAIDSLNELEWVNGEIWANVLQRPFILRIDPRSGDVIGIVDASQLAGVYGSRYRVLNGVAFDKRTGRVAITGKSWPFIFLARVSVQ